MSLIIDPTNEDVALSDGEVVKAIRIVPVTDDPRAPTADDLRAAQIVGYGKLNFDA